MTTNFHSDDQRSWEVHYKFYIHFFRKYYQEYASIKYKPLAGHKETQSDRLVVSLQKCGVDIAAIDPTTSNTLWWDEKADWHIPKNFCLEQYSNTMIFPWTLGWMHTSKAHRILYGFIRDEHLVEAYTINNHRLQEWFWPIHQHYHLDRVKDTPNRTGNRIVPIDDVIKNVARVKRYLITANGQVMQIPVFDPVSKYYQNGQFVNLENEEPPSTSEGLA